MALRMTQSAFGGIACMSGLAFGLACVLTTPAHALVIAPSFGASITGSANAAEIEAAINTAASNIGGLFSNASNVSILFETGSGDFLGSTQSGQYMTSYNNYVGQLQANSAANPANTVLASALANLSSGNDANGALNIGASSALLRMLGFSGATPCYNGVGVFVAGCGQTYDAVITLSSSNPIDYTRPLDGSSYDALRVIEHEIDEVLGAGGQGSTLNSQSVTCDPLSPTAYGPLDLYRFSAPGTASYTTCGSASSYLSVDGGVTSIAAFDQNANGDMGDFADGSTVQAAFTNFNQPADISATSPEYKMLESIGYDPVPEPGSLVLIGAALLGLGFVRRKRGARQGG